MKIYILADMEGISGIRRPEQVDFQHAEYAHGRELMMQDINVAVEGAFAGGASEVVVADTHGGGGQIQLHKMDARAIYEMPAVGRLMPSLDQSFAGVILLGHHARAGTLNGFLDHTMDSGKWFDYRLNDQVVGEIGIEAAWAGHFDVPVIMVAGDQATANEAKDLLGNVECAVVKWGIGRNRARCLPLPQAHQIVRDTAAAAVRRAKSIKSFKPTLPATIELTLYRTDMCDDLSVRPGAIRTGPRTLRRKIDCLLDVCRW